MSQDKFRSERKNMKKKKIAKVAVISDGFYESYDIRWLRELPEHPDYKLVAEFDALKEKK